MASLTYQQYEDSLASERYFDDTQLQLIKKHKHAEQLDMRMRQTYGYIFKSQRIKDRMYESINAPEKINYMSYLQKMQAVLHEGAYIYYLLKNSRDIEYAEFRVEQSRFFQLILKNHLFTLEELSACGPNIRKLDNQLSKDDAMAQLNQQNISQYVQKLRNDDQKYFKYLNFLNSQAEKEQGNEKFHLQQAILCIKKYYIQQKLASVFQQHITIEEVKQIIDERRYFEQLQLQQIMKNQSTYRIFSGEKAELDETSEYHKYKILLDPKSANIVRDIAESYFKQQFGEQEHDYYEYIQQELPYEVEFYFLTTIPEVKEALLKEEKRLNEEIDDFKIFRKKLLQQQKFDQQQQFSIIQKDYHYEMYAMIKKGRFAFLLDDTEMQEKYYNSLFGVDKEYYNYLKGLRNINFNNSLAIYYLIHRNHYQEQQGHFSHSNPMEVYDLQFEEFKYLLVNCHYFDERQMDQITMKDFVEKVYEMVQEDPQMNDSFQKIMKADIYTDDPENFMDFLTNHLMAVLKDTDMTDMIADIHIQIEYISYLEEHPELNFQHSMVVFFIHSLQDLNAMTTTMNVSQLIQTHGLNKALGADQNQTDPNATDGMD